MRKELADLAARERANVAAAARLEQELKDLAKQGPDRPRSSPGRSRRRCSGSETSSRPRPSIRSRTSESKLKQESTAGDSPPDAERPSAAGRPRSEEPGSHAGRMDALADAQKGMKSDPDKALAKLRNEFLQEQGTATANDLEDLKDVLKALREDLAKLQDKQEQLADQTEKAKDPELPAVEKKQFSLDDLLKKDLDQAKKLLDRERTKRMQKKDLPTDPFQPALGGPASKGEPRPDRKSSPSAKKDSGPGERRESLKEHQKDNLREPERGPEGPGVRREDARRS